MHLFKNILIPTDFSQAAWKAVNLGMSMISPHDSRLTLLHVFPSSAKFINGKKDEDLEDEKHLISLQKQMDEFCQTLERSAAIRVVPVILKGKVEPEILNYILENDFDIVIMGVNSNGMDNTPGSHVSNIISNANAPVMVVPNLNMPEREKEVA